MNSNGLVSSRSQGLNLSRSLPLRRTIPKRSISQVKNSRTKITTHSHMSRTVGQLDQGRLHHGEDAGEEAPWIQEELFS